MRAKLITQSNNIIMKENQVTMKYTISKVETRRLRCHQQQFAITPRHRSQIQFIIYAAIAYILSPIDLIPEAIFGVFGIIDDILFLFTCLSCIAIILFYPLFVEFRRALLDKLEAKGKASVLNKNI